MKVVTPKALARIAVALVVLGLALALGCQYSCRCEGRDARILMPATVKPETLRAHVEAIAAGEHNVTNPAELHRVAAYIETQWREQGHVVSRQTYRIGAVECANLEVTIPGTTRSNEIVIVGAHYDSVKGTAGANDNASGVAAMLEISRRFVGLPSARTVRFVAFVNEEPPYFETDRMGSRVYARGCRQRGDDIRAMLSLETLGYYSDAPGSQHFPVPLFKLFYPSRGNFVAFVSDYRSRPLLKRAVAAFRGNSNFPVECIAMFRRVAGIGWSDHASFWREGYPAVMVTDTALFRYPHYHSPEDTPDKVNYESLARVTEGLSGAVAALAEEQP
jgi:hypothetical protein